MDKLQLTEEETEELLKQAYSINRKLKQQMRGTDEGSTFPTSAKSQVYPLLDMVQNTLAQSLPTTGDSIQ